MIFETSVLLTTFVFLFTLPNLPLNVRCQDWSCIDNSDDYTTNGTYQSNLITLLATLRTNITANGFYNASLGLFPNSINAIALCRPDIQLETCRDCIRNSTIDLANLCPNMRQAIRWNLRCMLRYSNMPIMGIMSTTPGQETHHSLWNISSNPVAFMADLMIFLNDLRWSAAYRGNSSYKVAGDTRLAANITTLYGLAQCTPDLSPNDCNSCLANAIERVPRCCDRTIGARILMPSCILRYENSTFFDRDSLPQLAPLSDPPPPSPLSTPPSANRGNHVLVIRIVVSVVASVTLAAFAAFLVRRRMKQKPVEEFEPEDISGIESLQHDFDKIKAATNDFAEANKLGQGGFGVVYKGKLLCGQAIAVKRLSSNSCQGDLEFKNEVKLLAKLQHKNLVRLLGFSQKRLEKLLVYEFLQNSSLDKFIFDSSRCMNLSWDKRYKIVQGIARGLMYLHEDSRLRIIHRDLKASNILLDGNMNPKIADFGIARLFLPDETRADTNRIVGTFGYMAPEYAMHGQFSVKSDVFSYGVLVLEIISGQRNNNFQIGEDEVDLLTRVAWRNWQEGTTSNLINPVLIGGLGIPNEIVRCIHIGLLCVQQNATERPKMASVISMLDSLSSILPDPKEPAYFFADNYDLENSMVLENDWRETYGNEGSITELNPR